MIRTRAAALGLAAALTACGGATADRGGAPPPADAQSVCTHLAAEVTGANDSAVVRAQSANRAELERWLARHAGADGPTRSLDSYQGIDAGADTYTVCVFRTESRPVTMPRGVDTVADGTRIIAAGPKAYSIDAIGAAVRLAREMDGLGTAG